MQPILPIAPMAQPREISADDALTRVARDLEASFLSVMLRDSGVGRTPSGFGGGAGEDQFASFLTEAYARKIADRGGIGLAEVILRSLKGADVGSP